MLEPASDGTTIKKTDEFQIIQMEEWLLFSFNAMPAPSPMADSLSLSLSLSAEKRETACSHELKINHVTEPGQLYRSCITYGRVCFSSIFLKKKRALVPQ